MNYDVLCRAIERVLQVYIKEITLESTFASDLGADSLDMVQIFQLVEKELNIELKAVNLEDIVSVRDALNIIDDICGGNEVE